MNLHRLHLRPRSPWRTPWQADTLTGALCATCARVHGPDVLRAHIIDPMVAHEPPFVLSDAFPGGLLPIPTALRLLVPPDSIDHKTIKRARWMTLADFLAIRATPQPTAVPWDRLYPDAAVTADAVTRHNTLARDSDASLEDGGLFSRPDAILTGADRLSLYFRAADPAAADLLLDLLHELSLTGFGADIATGRGQFDIAGDPEPMTDLDAPSDNADAVVCLSTFQPAPGDPADGSWETFPKFAKLGPDLALPDVRKRTLIMLRPGACFRTDPHTPFLGRALPMNLILPEDAAATLRERGIEIIHPAFGLAVSANMAWESSP